MTYTFENFICGVENKTAYSFSKKISDGTLKNQMLYIYGKSGLGKTHLLKSIEYEIKSKRPEKKVLYIKIEDLLLDLQHNLRKNTLVLFRKKYTNIEYLLIDNFDKSVGQTSLLAEIIDIIDSLLCFGSTIVCSGISLLNPLCSTDIQINGRLLSGLNAKIENPGIELKMKIIENELSLYNMNISKEGIEILAGELDDNIFILKGTIRTFCNW